MTDQHFDQIDFARNWRTSILTLAQHDRVRQEMRYTPIVAGISGLTAGLLSWQQDLPSTD